MEKKKIVLLLGAVSILALLLTIFFLVGNNKNSQVSDQNDSGAEIPTERKNVESFPITVPSGSVEIKNIYKDGGELYDRGVTFRNNDDFSIAYAESDQSFAISISNAKDPIGARNKSEQELLSALGISKEQACELTVLLQVPYSVRADLSGTNYGLSFCPDGKYFEEIKGL